MKEYYQENKEQLLQYNKEYRASERGSKLRRIIEQRKGIIARQDRIHLIIHLGGFCYKCGFDDVRALDLNHKNGGGRKERRRMGGNNFYHYYATHLDEAKEKLDVLCCNHNRIRWYENEEWKVNAQPDSLSLTPRPRRSLERKKQDSMR